MTALVVSLSARGPAPLPAPAPAPGLLTADQERTLAERLAAGDSAAAERLVVANLRLVLYVARAYVGRGLPLEDLVQEGTLGLMTAVQKFDPSKGFRFSTYAIWWVRQGITRALAEQSRTIRLPVHVCVLLAHANDAEQRLVQHLGRAPTTAEVAAEIGVPPERLTEIWRHRSAVASLDRQVGDDGDPLADFIPGTTGSDGNDGSPEDTLLHHLKVDAVRSLLKALTPRERTIIQRRFGLTADADGADDEGGAGGAGGGAGSCATLTEVAQELRLSRERIRQIERLALAKLKHRVLHSHHRRALRS